MYVTTRHNRTQGHARKYTLNYLAVSRTLDRVQLLCIFQSRQRAFCNTAVHLVTTVGGAVHCVNGSGHPRMRCCSLCERARHIRQYSLVRESLRSIRIYSNSVVNRRVPSMFYGRTTKGVSFVGLRHYTDYGCKYVVDYSKLNTRRGCAATVLWNALPRKRRYLDRRTRNRGSYSSSTKVCTHRRCARLYNSRVYLTTRYLRTSPQAVRTDRLEAICPIKGHNVNGTLQAESTEQQGLSGINPPTWLSFTNGYLCQIPVITLSTDSYVLADLSVTDRVTGLLIFLLAFCLYVVCTNALQTTVLRKSSIGVLRESMINSTMNNENVIGATRSLFQESRSPKVKDSRNTTQSSWVNSRTSTGKVWRTSDTIPRSKGRSPLHGVDQFSETKRCGTSVIEQVSLNTDVSFSRSPQLAKEGELTSSKFSYASGRALPKLDTSIQRILQPVNWMCTHTPRASGPSVKAIMEFWFFPFVSGVGLIALLVSNDFLFLYIAVELYSIAIYVWFGYIAANPMYLLRENDWRKRYTLPMSVGVGTPHPRKADAVGDGRLGSVAQLSTGSERNRLDTQPNVIQRNCIRCMCNCQPMSSSLLSRTLTFPSLENVQVAEQKSTLVRNSRNEESILCAVQGALRYVLVGIFGSLLLIYGICNFYVTFGTLNFDELALLNLIGDSSSSVSQSTFACTFFLLGLFIKMGLAPFHIWIISVYDRLPWSLFMYVSMLPKIAYFFVLWQILTLFSLLENYLFFLFSFIAIINVITGTFYAIFQKSLKRFFLGSSLVSSGYLLITLALPTSWNFFTFVVYLTIYVITMFTFYCIIMRYNQVLFSAPVLNLRQKIDLHSNGSAEPHPCLVFASRPLECSHSVSSINTSSDRFVRVYDWHRKLSSVQSQLSAPTPTSSFGEVDIQFSPTLASGSIDSNVYFGQLYKLPTFAKVMLTVLLFSLIGIPPLAGFYGKLFVFIYLIHNNFYVITLLLFFQSVLAGYYYLRLIRILFFHRIDSSSATLIKKNMANVIADQITTPIHCEPTIMSKSTSLSPSTQWLRMYPSRGLQSTDHTYGNVDLNSTHLSLHTNQKLDQVTPTHLYPNKRRMVVCSVSFRKNQYSSNSYRQPKSKSTPLIELFLYVNVAILFLFGLCL